MSSSSSLGESWSQLCTTLDRLGQDLLAASPTPVDAGEAMRFLSRALGYANMLQQDGADPEFPRLLRSSHETLKLFSDSPDYYYQLATIAGSRDYRIHGTRGSAPTLAFTTYGPSPTGIVWTGEFSNFQPDMAPDERFELIVSAQPQLGHWLPMAENAFMLQVRNIFPDYRRDDPASLTIEAIGAPARPAWYDAERARGAIDRAAQQLQHVIGRAVDFTRSIEQRTGVNDFDFDQDAWHRIGGNSRTYYVQGIYDIEPDEALIVECDPPACSYFSFQLNNIWLESLDYEHHPIYYNNHTASRRPDGSLYFVIADRAASVGDWLDTAGHRRGTMVWKWNDPAHPPRPTVRKVKLADLG